MRPSKLQSFLWYLLGALPGVIIGVLAARAGANQYILTHPGEEYDTNLRSIISVVIVPLGGVGGAIIGVMLVGLTRAPKAATGWIILSLGSAMVLAMLPIRASHGWSIALGDLLVGVLLIGIGLKIAK